MTVYHLAQLNIAKMKFAIESPEMLDFVNSLDEINALADNSPGFIWRLCSDDGDTTSIDCFGCDRLVNMSVWKDVQSLHDYVYKTSHAKIMSRRRQWFDRILEVYTVLWWLPAGAKPSLQQAKEKLELLNNNGPDHNAFTFKKTFPAPNVNHATSNDALKDLCSKKDDLM